MKQIGSIEKKKSWPIRHLWRLATGSPTLVLKS